MDTSRESRVVKKFNGGVLERGIGGRIGGCICICVGIEDLG
jgi:hypothetical protein